MSRIDDTRMPLGEHIEELRRCLIRALLGIAVGMALCLIFGEHIMKVLCWPGAVAMRYQGVPVRLRTLAPAEGFVTYLKVCLICGAIFAAPYSLLQIWRFIAAGLHDNERGVVRKFVPFSAILFVVGVTFFFVVIAPICLSFFLGFGEDHFPMPTWANPVLSHSTGPDPDSPASQPATSDADSPATRPAAPAFLPVLTGPPDDPPEGAAWIDARSGDIHIVVNGGPRRLDPAPRSFLSAEFTLGHYMTFVSWLSLVFGAAFQTPIFVIVLARTGLVTTQKMKHYRRHVIVGLLVIAATLTPPDVISQIALGVPMYLLFELGLILAARGRNKK